MDTKRELFEAIEKITDTNVLKSILQSHLLTKSTEFWDAETKQAIDERIILSEKDMNIKSTSLVVQSVISGFPSTICDLIAEFAQKYLVIEIGQNKGGTMHVTEDMERNDQIVMERFHREQTLTLKHPKLLGENACPFAVSFNISFPSVPHGRQHGGIFFDHKQESMTRWDGHKTLAQGARCTVVDWIPMGLPPQNTTYSGMRVYGIASNGADLRSPVQRGWNRYNANEDLPNPPSQWKIVFYEGNQCELFLDGDKLHSFTCFANDGFIGFWCYAQCGMTISNLDVVQL